MSEDKANFRSGCRYNKIYMFVTALKTTLAHRSVVNLEAAQMGSSLAHYLTRFAHFFITSDRATKLCIRYLIHRKFTLPTMYT